MENRLSAADHRANARLYLGNKIFANSWMVGLLVMLISSLILGFASGISVGIAAVILAGPLAFGTTRWFLLTSRNGSEPLDTMFDGFKYDFAQNMLLGLMIGLFTFLWSLLLIIPGIVKSYSYSMAYYIKCDHPEYNWKQCIDESRRIMRGNKWRLFCLDLSFIGWILLAGLASAMTLGVGSIMTLWINPYMTAARTSFYRSIATEKGDDSSYFEEGFFESTNTFKSI